MCFHFFLLSAGQRACAAQAERWTTGFCALLSIGVSSEFLLIRCADQVSDCGIREWLATAFVDVRPELVSRARVGGVARPVSKQAARIDYWLDETVDDPGERDPFRWKGERESALRTAGAFQDAGLDERVQRLAHVVAGRPGSFGDCLGTERLPPLLGGKHNHRAKRVIRSV